MKTTHLLEGYMLMGGNRRGRRVLFAMAMLWFLSIMVGRGQTGYTYTVIADLAGCSTFYSPAINNKGEVAFGAQCASPIGPPSGGTGIWRGDGGALAPIYIWTSASGTQHVPQIDFVSLNDSGAAAFAVNGPCPNGGAAAIWIGNGGSLNTLYDICTTPGFTSVLEPSISNDGGVAFMAASGNSYDTVLRVSNGATLTIAGPDTVSSVGQLSGAIDPSINNNGLVAFTGNVSDLGNAGALFTGAGGPLTAVSLDNPSQFNGINDSGVVAFVANTIAVQTGAGGDVTTLAKRTSEGGMYQSFPGNGAAINKAGKVAFMAYLPSGTLGVFTGPDPEVDVVLKTGDFIPGFGTVTFVSILREAINDSGQVAMAVSFSDGGTPTAAIIRADPPNNPPVASDFGVTVAAGGSVSSTLLATDPDGDPLTYAIVDNGTKGTAVVTDTETGAFTYTANAGSANGSDNFTFQATDSRGLTSNVAAVTVAIQPAATCAVNVTSSIRQVKAKKAANADVHVISLRNDAAAITGPISLALDSLTSGALLTNADGVTDCASPAGSPYINVDVGADSIWSTGEVVEIELRFDFTAPPPKKTRITYTMRVLAGPGGR